MLIIKLSICFYQIIVPYLHHENNQTPTTMKTKQQVIVHLRTRPLADGSQQLYLDITEWGKRRKEALHMALLPGKDRATKKANEETRMIAERKARAREEELLSDSDGYRRDTLGLDRSFFAYIEQCMNQRSGNTACNWRNCINHLRIYETDSSITFRRITPNWIKGFKDYLVNRAKSIITGNKISQNTQNQMFRTLTACIHQALSDGVLQRDPSASVKGIGKEESKREHLTNEEFRKLCNTPCRVETTRRAFLVCCMTGRRYSDVSTITWANIISDNGQRYVDFRQHKTGGNTIVPINELAIALIGDAGRPTEQVFASLPRNTNCNIHLREWCDAAGILKPITFHCSRHTFACLTLQAGADLYTTSKLLGHTDIKTTQIYAKVVDQSKVSAVNNLLKIL